MKGPLDLSRELLAADVPHEFVRLPRRISSSDDLPDVLGVDSQACVSVRVVLADGRPVAVAHPSRTLLSIPSVAAAIGAAEVRLAPASATSVATDFVAGLVAPVALPSGLPLLVDAALGIPTVLYTATGDAGTALKIRSAGLLAHLPGLVDTFTVPAVLPLAGLRLRAQWPHAGIGEIGAPAL